MTDVLGANWNNGSAVPGATRLDAVAERTAAVGVGLLIVTGFAASYTTLRDLAVEVGGFSPWLAPVVPLSFDLGIIVLSLKVVLSARAGRDARVLRVLVLILSAATVVANGAASSTAVGRLLHAVPPAMFVICFETLAASARHDAHTRRASGAHERSGARAVIPALTAARWVLAPRQTWVIWRTRVLSGDEPTVRESSVVAQAPPVLPHPPDDERAESAATRVDESLFRWRPETAADPARPQAHHPVVSSVPRDRTSGADDRPVLHRDRTAVAVQALRADPAITAVALADHLRAAGHPVSVRTAQRVRHQAEQTLRDAPVGHGAVVAQEVLRE